MTSGHVSNEPVVALKGSFYLIHIKVAPRLPVHGAGMKPIRPPVLICLLLALSLAFGGMASGRAAGLRAVEIGTTRMVICADGAMPQTVLITRDGRQIDLPHCAQMLCEDCLQAGAAAMLATLTLPDAPLPRRAAKVIPGFSLNHPGAVLRARSRAPPAASALA